MTTDKERIAKIKKLHEFLKSRSMVYLCEVALSNRYITDVGILLEQLDAKQALLDECERYFQMHEESSTYCSNNPTREQALLKKLKETEG